MHHLHRNIMYYTIILKKNLLWTSGSEVIIPIIVKFFMHGSVWQMKGHS